MPLGCVILEGGGNAELRGWKAFGQWVNTIRKASPKSVIPERALYAARKIVTFVQGGDTFSKKVMEDLSSAERKSFVDESSSIVPSLLKRECVGANCQMLSERVRRLSERALQKGLDCSRRAKHKWLSQALKGGAGPAHRWCWKEDALPEPPLVVRDSQGIFTADPQCEAELYAHEWKREWGGEDAIGIVKENEQFSCSTGKHVAEPREWASKLDLRAGNVRKACLSFPSKKAIGLDQHAFTDIALLPDNALESLGEIIRQMFCQVGSTNSATFAIVGLLGQENGGSRTIAILHATYCLTMRLVSAHNSRWDVKFAGKWDSALKGNAALRAHVARAVGFELAHTEGQCVVHFLWDMWKFDDSVKAHLLIPQLVARGYPLEIFGFALVDTQNHRDVFKLATDTATSSLVVHPAFWQIVSRAALGPELFCLNWSKLWGMWFLSTPGFWQTPDASASLDGALFNKAQIIDCFSRDVEMQTWKRAAGHSLSSGMEKGTNTDLCQEGQVSADHTGKFHGCKCAGHSCLWADGSIPNQFLFSVFVATREPWPPGSMNCGNVVETD